MRFELKAEPPRLLPVNRHQGMSALGATPEARLKVPPGTPAELSAGVCAGISHGIPDGIPHGEPHSEFPARYQANRQTKVQSAGRG